MRQGYRVCQRVSARILFRYETHRPARNNQAKTQKMPRGAAPLVVMLERDKRTKELNAKNVPSQDVYIVTARSYVLKGIFIRSIIFYISVHILSLTFCFLFTQNFPWLLSTQNPQMASHDIVPRGEADFDLYPYTPSAGAGYTFLILFAIGGLTHLIMLIPLRSWFFIPFVLGCVGQLPRCLTPSPKSTSLIV